MHLFEPIRPSVPASAPSPEGRVRRDPASLPQPAPEAHGGVEGRLERYAPFASSHVEPRNVDVWLPPGYDDDPARRYPVVYMHDGQNLFVPELSFSGVDWGVDEAVAGLAAAGEIEAPVVVGVWNTPKRIAEYMPQQPVEEAHYPRVMERFVDNYGHAPCSDAYLRFLVSELKPFVDATYRTRPGRADTLIVGSSMGALVSLYALCACPDVFGGAACLSTSWTVGGRVVVPYLRRTIPDPHTHRIYFDYGVEAHIGRYEFYQRKVDLLFEAAGYARNVHRLTRRFPGAGHTEAAWRERLAVPLRFLLRAY